MNYFLVVRGKKPVPGLTGDLSIALATVIFFNEEQPKKKRFISAISKLKWYNHSVMLVSIGIKRLLFLCMGIFPLLLRAQNLVANPSFESYAKCPERLGLFDTNVASWSCPTSGTTDYFNACSSAMGTPENFKGRQPADFGDGYTGMYVFAPDDYREYIQVALTEPLQAGKKYQVSFYVSLAEKSDSAIKEFGVLFSNYELKIPTQKNLSKKKRYQLQGHQYTYLEIGYTNFFSDTKDWILVNSQFTAKGNERFMCIGNFKANARTRMFKTKKNAKQGAYYYIDMVAVSGVEKMEVAKPLVAIADGKETSNIELDRSYIFKNVLFEFDRSSLLKSAKNELEKVYTLLRSNANLKIAIDGHTDNVGSVAYNQQLSQLRAKAVANHLQELGVPKERIVWQGHGGNSPITENETEQGRQQNRRVEFTISKSVVAPD